MHLPSTYLLIALTSCCQGVISSALINEQGPRPDTSTHVDDPKLEDRENACMAGDSCGDTAIHLSTSVLSTPPPTTMTKAVDVTSTPTDTLDYPTTFFPIYPIPSSFTSATEIVECRKVNDGQTQCTTLAYVPTSTLSFSVSTPGW